MPVTNTYLIEEWQATAGWREEEKKASGTENILHAENKLSDNGGE